MRLLESVYQTLLVLIRVRFPSSKEAPGRRQLLDRLLRSGIFKGYVYAGEYVKVADLLIRKLSDIVNEMGLWSAKHLKVLQLDSVGGNCY